MVSDVRTEARSRQGYVKGSIEPAWSPSKITPPAVADATPNARLFGIVDSAIAKPVVWLHGPPGAGKTTLVARYLADRAIDPIWYRLDDDDTDPATFFFYVALAAARANPTIAVALPVVRPEYLRNLGTFARRFFRALFDTTDRPVLVFDDYQELDERSTIHGCLVEGFKEISAFAHVIVVSREPPPKSFARLRVNGTIEVVPPLLFRITRQEAAALAADRALKVSSAVVDRVVTQTDGWTAGIILMMEAVQTGTPTLAGEGQPIPEVLFDYFAGEVFQRMDERSRQILMTLAIVPSLSADAAVLLTKDNSARGLLEDLAKRNYFTARDEETNYRFHPLFRDFLLTQAQQSLTDTDRATVRLRAAQVLEQSGQIDAAVALYHEAGSWDDLARVTRAWAGQLVEKGRHAALLGWLERLPPEKIEPDAWLCFWLATAWFAASPGRSRPLFRAAFDLFGAASDTTGMLLAWAGLANAITEDPSSNQTELDGDIALLRALMPTLRTPSPPLVEFRVALAMYLALARRSADRVELAQWRDRALNAAAVLGKPGLVILVRNYIAINAIIDNDFVTSHEQFLAIPPPEALEQEPLLQVVAYLSLGLAQLYNQAPGCCDTTAEKALASTRASGVFLWTHLQAAFDAITESDLPRSQKWLRRMAQLTGKVAVYHSAHYQMIAAGVALLAGDIDAAIRSGRLAVDMLVADGWFLYESMARVVLAQALDSAGQFDAADAELIAADAASARIASLSMKTSTVFLRADFLLQRGLDREGLAALAAAMEWGERTGSRRTGLTPLRNSRLCGRALMESIRPDYALVLIQASALPPPDRFIEQWPWPLKITTFGGFRIFKSGEPLVLSRKTPRRLFALLKAIITFGATQVSEADLVDAVWPDEEGDAGHSAFYVAIHRLRKLIGDSQFLILRDGRVSIDPTRCWLDLWAFEAGLSHPNTRFSDRALALYKGVFLAGDDDLPWCEPRRRQLAARHARVLASRATKPMQADRPAVPSMRKTDI